MVSKYLLFTDYVSLRAWRKLTVFMLLHNVAADPDIVCQLLAKGGWFSLVSPPIKLIYSREEKLYLFALNNHDEVRK